MQKSKITTDGNVKWKIFSVFLSKKHILLHIWHFGCFWVNHTTMTEMSVRTLPKANYQPLLCFKLYPNPPIPM